VVDVPRHDFAGTGKQALQTAEKWGEQNIVGLHSATDSDGVQFTYEISKKSLSKYVHETSTEKSENIGVHLAVLKKLPEVISESIEAEVHTDNEKKKEGGKVVDNTRNPENGIKNDSLVHRFYGAVNIEGVTYRVKTTMVENKNGGLKANAHAYEITKIEVLPVETDNTTNGAQRSTSSREGIIEVAKLLKGVEKSYDKGVKLLETSSEAAKSGEEQGEYGGDEKFV
jgi:hypothetical protein